MTTTLGEPVSVHYRLQRMAAVDLEFDGYVVAEESSHEEGKERWTEVRIYATDTGIWVTEVKGCSSIEGEVSRVKATACSTPQEVVDSFRQWSSKRRAYYWTDIVLDALDTAAGADPRLASANKEQV